MIEDKIFWYSTAAFRLLQELTDDARFKDLEIRTKILDIQSALLEIALMVCPETKEKENEKNR